MAQAFKSFLSFLVYLGWAALGVGVAVVGAAPRVGFMLAALGWMAHYYSEKHMWLPGPDEQQHEG